MPARAMKKPFSEAFLAQKNFPGDLCSFWYLSPKEIFGGFFKNFLLFFFFRESLAYLVILLT